MSGAVPLPGGPHGLEAPGQASEEARTEREGLGPEPEVGARAAPYRENASAVFLLEIARDRFGQLLRQASADQSEGEGGWAGPPFSAHGLHPPP